MFLTDLPDEMLLQILAYFPADALITKIALISRQFNMLSRDESLWKIKCAEAYRPDDQIVQVDKTWLTNFFRAVQAVPSKISPVGDRPKYAYKCYVMGSLADDFLDKIYAGQPRLGKHEKLSLHVEDCRLVMTRANSFAGIKGKPIVIACPANIEEVKQLNNVMAKLVLDVICYVVQMPKLDFANVKLDSKCQLVTTLAYAKNYPSIFLQILELHREMCNDNGDMFSNRAVLSKPGRQCGLM